MGKIFDINNGFMQGISKIVDCIFLALLWILCSIPIFTIGAASSAMYYTFHKVIREGRGYLLESFFGSFKSSFKQSTIMWIILLIIYVLNFFGYSILWAMNVEGYGVTFFMIMQTIVLSFVTICGIYAFAYEARFEDSVKTIIKNSVLLSILNFGWSLVLIVIFAFALALALLVPSLCFVFITLYNWAANSILEAVFKKIMPTKALEEEDEI